MSPVADNRATKPASYRIRALDRGLDVLEAFTLQRTELGIGELASITAIPKPTMVRVLSVLAERGYVERDEETERYRLSTRPLELGSIYLQSTSLEREARPIMSQLAADTNQTANLGVLQGSDIVHIEVVAPDRPVRFWASVGTREAAYLCGLGKVMLASLNEDAIDAILAQPREAMTPNTITDADGLRRELIRVRDVGYAFDDEESHIGVRCIAAPIRDRTGRTTAAVSISGSRQEFNVTEIETLAQRVVSAADDISARLGAGARMET